MQRYLWDFSLSFLREMFVFVCLLIKVFSWNHKRLRHIHHLHGANKIMQILLIWNQSEVFMRKDSRLMKKLVGWIKIESF